MLISFFNPNMDMLLGQVYPDKIGKMGNLGKIGKMGQKNSKTAQIGSG